MSRFGTITLNGHEYDLDDLDLDEVEAIEDLVPDAFGQPTAFNMVNWASSKGMKAAAFVLLKRDNPDLTMAEVGKIKLIQFAEPDEEMPESPPDTRTSEGSESEREPDGALASVGSTPGSPLSPSDDSS